MNREDPPMPRFGRTALELLDAKNAEPHSLSSYYGLNVVFGLFGASTILLTNWAQRKPRYAGR